MIKVFVSSRHFVAVPLGQQQQVWNVINFYDIGKLGLQNPCFKAIPVRYTTTNIQLRVRVRVCLQA